MKKTVFIINISRDITIIEKDLVFALKKKYIEQGAALDVFEEPIGQNNPIIKMRNVILVLHLGSAGYDTRRKMSELVATNIIKVLKTMTMKLC
jgi:lactate dehydrogenase-like 2-hydroxyacid dehydrogenase